MSQNYVMPEVLEIGEAEDAVSAGAAAGETRPEADEEAAGKHPRQLAGGPEANDLVEHAEVPCGAEAAAKHRGDESAKDKAADERHAPVTGRADRIAGEVWRRHHEAADILETGGDAEAPVRDKQQRERDGGDARAGDRPMQRLEVVKNQHLVMFDVRSSI